jgi:hypothetical protein
VWKTEKQGQSDVLVNNFVATGKNQCLAVLWFFKELPVTGLRKKKNFKEPASSWFMKILNSENRHFTVLKKKN